MDGPPHEAHLQRTVELAECAAAAHSYPVGAVLVCDDGRTVFENYNHYGETTDKTAHAEMGILRAASESLSQADSDSAWTLYTSGEPCLMCLGAILLYPIRTLVWALGPVSLGGSAFDVLRRSEYSAVQFMRLSVIREPDPAIRDRSRSLLRRFCLEHEDERLALFLE